MSERDFEPVVGRWIPADERDQVLAVAASAIVADEAVPFGFGVAPALRPREFPTTDLALESRDDVIGRCARACLEEVHEVSHDGIVLRGHRHRLRFTYRERLTEHLAEAPEQVADIRLVAHGGLAMAERREVVDAAGAVRAETRPHSIERIGVELGEVPNIARHVLPVPRPEPRCAVLIMPALVVGLTARMQDGAVQRGRDLVSRPVPTLVDAYRLGEREVAEEFGILLAAPELHDLVIPVVTVNLARVDGRDVVVPRIRVAHLDELLPIFRHRLPLVFVGVEVLLCAIATEPEAVEHFRIAVEVALRRIPALRRELHIRHALLLAVAADEREADGRAVNDRVVRDGAAELAGMTAGANARG